MRRTATTTLKRDKRMSARISSMDTAKLFSTGHSQAVRLPKQYRFKGDSVFIRRVGRAVVLLPRPASWDSLRDALELFEPGLRLAREQPARAGWYDELAAGKADAGAGWSDVLPGDDRDWAW